MPILSKADFDIEAEKFLIKYCPQALEEPMAVPVRDIAKRMHLKIKEGMQFNAKPPNFVNCITKRESMFEYTTEAFNYEWIRIK